jgi:Ni/Fe-hydrogenase subunit HybB-like protein
LVFLCLVQCLAACIHICIGQDLAEPLRRQLYQALVSKHFLASAIVSGFGVCIWGGSPGGGVSGWPFLLSLFYSSSLYFF